MRKAIRKTGETDAILGSSRVILAFPFNIGGGLNL